MNDTLCQILLGEFRYTTLPFAPTPLTFQNATPVDVRISYLTPEGWLAGPSQDGTLLPGYAGVVAGHGGGVAQLTISSVTGWFVFSEAHSGSFIGAQDVIASSGLFSITKDLLVAPGDAGPIPEPGPFHRLIPVDSQSVVVGIGSANGKHIVREQCWRRLPDSFTLAPKETRTISRTVTSGLERTSTDSTTVAQSLGLGVSVGWGPVSASLSASISRSSTRTQSVTVSERRTTFVSETVTNALDNPVMYLLWQLIDTVSIHDATGPVAAVTSVGEPVVIRGPYPLDRAGRLTAMVPVGPPATPTV